MTVASPGGFPSMISPCPNLPGPAASTAQAGRIDHLVHGVAGTTRLVDYMKDRLAVVPVTEVGDLITSGFVTIAIGSGHATGRTGDLVANGDRIAIDAAAVAALRNAGRWNTPWDRALAIVHEDEDIVVVDKPAPMHVHPLGDRREGTLVSALVHHAGGRDDQPWARWRPHVVQRLDCVVSGLLVVAKSAAAKAELVRAQKRHGIARIYCALVTGAPTEDEGIVDAPVGREPGRGYRRALLPAEDGGRRAVTRWRVVERRNDRTLVELEPETGRTHQLRVHLASMGHPIAGDDLYQQPSGEHAGEGGTELRLGEREPVPIALHATALRLKHPRSGCSVEFFSPLPARFHLDPATPGRSRDLPLADPPRR